MCEESQLPDDAEEKSTGRNIMEGVVVVLGNTRIAVCCHRRDVRLSSRRYFVMDAVMIRSFLCRDVVTWPFQSDLGDAFVASRRLLHVVANGRCVSERSCCVVGFRAGL